jgi:N-dimethylarginine dimethylaminohydrolase
MDVNNKVIKDKVVQQWNSLESKIKELGANVKLIEEQPGLPDMVFTANAGLILKNGHVIISHFKHPERRGEEQFFEKWFSNPENYTKSYSMSFTFSNFEGAGDALYLGDTLVGGYGFRSDQDFYFAIETYMMINCPKEKVVKVRLVDPYFYHLDTCFCPLNDMDYMIWPGAFDQDSLNIIRNIGKGTEISVPEDEAKLFACNAVRIGQNVILPAGCPETMRLLEEAGYITHPLEMSEFIKSGGACKCLTLVI